MSDQTHDLHVGDIVRHRESGEGYVITNDYGEYWIATRTISIHTLRDWQVVRCVEEPLDRGPGQAPTAPPYAPVSRYGAGGTGQAPPQHGATP